MSNCILVLTTSRADYGFLCPLLDKLRDDNSITLKLAVCGSHLSKEFGETVSEIEDDGRIIDVRYKTVVTDNESTSQSFSLAVIGFSKAIDQVKPDLIFLPGDRYEVLAAATAALFAKVPVAHYAGGQITEGAWDDSIRHAVTKLSHMHFTSTNEYKNRIIQLGEDPEHVFVTGSLGLDNILSLQRFSREYMEKELNFKFGSQSALVTFHPVTLDDESSNQQLIQLLEALDMFPKLNLLFTMPNVDEGSRELIATLKNYIKSRPRSILVPSLGRVRYLSALNIVDVVIGNSSSGIIETPSFAIPTVNIGDRQKGRIRAQSIIDCDSSKADVTQAIKLAFSHSFRSDLDGMTNPYGDGKAASRIHSVLRKSLPISLLRKYFYNIN